MDLMSPRAAFASAIASYFKTNKSFNFLSFSCSNNLHDWQQVNYFEILDRKSENPGHTLFIKIKIK
jgi:hypothetical protein